MIALTLAQGFAITATLLSLAALFLCVLELRKMSKGLHRMEKEQRQKIARDHHEGRQWWPGRCWYEQCDNCENQTQGDSDDTRE